jgi:hypothetical protein
MELSKPEESNFEGSILENWNFLEMESMVVMAMEYLVLEAKYLGKIQKLKFMVKVERKELELKMSYGDKRLNNNMM